MIDLVNKIISNPVGAVELHKNNIKDLKTKHFKTLNTDTDGGFRYIFSEMRNSL